MNRNSKKGFTIVELIIVIAVIAVLAAVLIPTFSNLIQKANVAADQTLIKNLNTALAMDTTVSKHETMTQALEATKANGFDVEKIVARATDNKIVWDSANDCFAYIEKGKNEPTYIPDTKANPNVADYQLWTIVNNTTLDAKYSSYIAGTSVSGAVEATKGVDVGENTAITAVTYKNETTTAQTVTIRTNGGTLEVDAITDTVKHYGLSDKVIVTAVADKSYDEFGQVKGNIEVAKGHVVVDSTAKVESVIATTADVKIEVKNNSTEVKAKDDVDLSGKVEGATAKTVKYVSTIDELQNAEGEVVLNADLRGSITFSSGKTVVLDANGHTVKGAVIIINNSNLTIKGNGNFSSSGYLLWVGNSNTRSGVQTAGGTLTIESGNFNAGEACVANMTGANYEKSTITINGGTFTSLDNGVLMSNGSTSVVQGANWNINGGTFNCNIKTKGYIAFGMYMCNTDIATINGGTFNVKNGVGIVCRSGKTTVNKGVTFNIDNDGTISSGKVGDSNILLSVSSCIVSDEKSGYPAGAPEIINNSQYTIIENK